MRSPTYTLFIGTLFFAPLAFGSVETWSIGLVEILVFLTALTYLLETRHKSNPFLKVPGILPLFLLLVFIWTQLIPLPPSVVKLIAPGIYQAYAPILNIQDANHWIPLTVNQKSTLLEALRITSYAFFYILTVQLLSRKNLLLKTVKIIAGLAITISFFAILQKFTSPDLIYWFRPVPAKATPIGPWINYNHYAGFMELLFPLVLALFFYYRPNFSNQQSFRSRIVSIFSSPKSNIQFFLGFSIVLILASIFIGLSRGGIIATNLALIFFLVLLTKKTNNYGKTLLLFLFGGVLLAVTWFGWAPILARFSSSTTETGSIIFDRWIVWKNCAPLIKDFLITGSGFGTFIHTYPQYNNFSSLVIFAHAHNDYIELLTDGGLIGFLLATWFVLSILHNGFKKLSIRKEPYSILLIIAGLTGIVSISIHSITDFNMHNGANGLYFFFLCGLLISAGNTRIHYRNNPTLLKESSPKWKLTCLTALPLLLLSVVIQGGILNAAYLYKQVSKIYLNPQLSEHLLQQQLATINKAIIFDPLEGHYFYYKGNLLSYLKNKSAFSTYLQASKKDPLEGTYLQRVGLLLSPNENKQATLLMTEGYKRSQNKRQLIFVIAEWYIQQNNKQKAIDILQQGAAKFPVIVQNLPQFFVVFNFTKKEIISIFPESTPAWILLGDFFEKTGQIENAEYFRLHALDFLEMEKIVKPQYFTQLFWFYMKQKRENDAISILRLGIKWLPNYANFHIYLGNYYKQQNIPYRAKEEYEQALMLDPGNAKIRVQIQSVK